MYHKLRIKAKFLNQLVELATAQAQAQDSACCGNCEATGDEKDPCSCVELWDCDSARKE